MDLNQLRNLKKVFDAQNPESRQLSTGYMEAAMKWLNDELPALNEMDRAAVAWFIAELLSSLRQVELRRLDDVVANSACGYGLASLKLMGWMSE